MNSDDNSEVTSLENNKASPFLCFSACHVGQQLLSFDFEPRQIEWQFKTQDVFVALHGINTLIDQ